MIHNFEGIYMSSDWLAKQEMKASADDDIASIETMMLEIGAEDDIEIIRGCAIEMLKIKLTRLRSLYHDDHIFEEES